MSILPNKATKITTMIMAARPPLLRWKELLSGPDAPPSVFMTSPPWPPAPDPLYSVVMLVACDDGEEDASEAATTEGRVEDGALLLA